MKKIFTYSVLAVLVAVLFTSCVKVNVHDDKSYWLSQERGDVVYSNNFCGFYVVETDYGYTIIQNVDGVRTYEGDVLYGDFGGYGTRNFYNYTADLLTGGNVMEYDLSYYQAQDAIDYYCPAGRTNGYKLKQRTNSQNKMSRDSVTISNN